MGIPPSVAITDARASGFASVKSKQLPELVRLGENEVRPVLKSKKTKKRKGMETA